MDSATDVPDAARLTDALDVLDELHRRLGDEGLRDLGERHRRRRVGALLAAVRAGAAERRARDPGAGDAVAEALADMRAGAARSPVLHTLARALGRVRGEGGPDVAEAVRRLAGELPEDMLRAIEGAVRRTPGAR